MRGRHNIEQRNRKERELAAARSNEGGVGFTLWPVHHRVNKLRQKGSLGMSFGVLENQHNELKPPTVI